MNYKNVIKIMILIFIFLNLSGVYATSDIDSEIIDPHVDEFEDEDISYHEDVVEINESIINDEDGSFYGEINQVESSPNKIDTFLDVDNLEMYYNNGSTLDVVLKDSSNNILVNKNIFISINGVNYMRTTNNFGIASMNINLLPGVYIVNIYFNGDSNFNPSTAITGVFVKDNIYTEDLVKMFKNSSRFVALFSDNQGNPLKNQKITFTINGVVYSRITNDEGVASLAINLLPGNYTIITKIDLLGKEVSNNIEVKSLISENKDFVKYFRNNSNYVVKIIGKNGLVVGAGENVTFNINGVLYTRTTNETGYVGLNINLNPGEYIITVEYLGCMISNKITVLSILISKDLEMNYQDGSNFRVKILDGSGNPLKNVNVMFNINGVIYNKVSDNHGIARIAIRLLMGEYIITSTYNDYSVANRIIISNNCSNNIFSSFGISHNSGFYNVSSLEVSLFCDDLTILKYSLDNVNWSEHLGSFKFSFPPGIWNLYYKFDFSDTYHVNYKIDNIKPNVWANYGSDLYDSPIIVNLTAYDYVDENPVIFYTLNGSDPKKYGVKYNNSFTISSNTTLKFYAKDNTNHKSDVITINYIFANIGNLNTGKGFSSIQSAINDVNTINGNIIKVKRGIYAENILVSKSIALVGDLDGEVILKSVTSNNPVISITKNASNTLINGFKVIDSNFGIVVFGSDNVTLLSNIFNNVVESINCQNDSNTQIVNNTIKFSYLVNNVTGIISRGSQNLLILNNSINLKSRSNSCGIISVLNEGCNISIINNYLINTYSYKHCFGINLKGFNISVKGNNISNFYNGLAIDCSNSIFSSNILFENWYGLYIHDSKNNLYKSNDIWGNGKYGVYLDDNSVSLNDKFYLNRLVNNGYFDFYSISNYVMNVSDNWWGTNNPTISKINSNLVNVYNGTGKVILDSWIKTNIYSNSYEIFNGIIQTAKIYIDMNYNNFNNKVSEEEYLPNMLGHISCFNDNDLSIEKLIKIVDGVGYFHFNLVSLFESSENITIRGFMDNTVSSFIFNKYPKINLNIISSAWDLHENSFVNYELDIPMINNTSWITVAWGQTSLYSGFIDVIVNGIIVGGISISNVGYQAWKDRNFSPQFFEAMKMFNIIFASTKDGVFEPNDYLINFIQDNNLKNNTLNELKDYVLIYLKLNYGITSSECSFIKQYANTFVDVITVGIDYHGDISPDIRLNIGDGLTKIKGLPSSFAVRQSNIYYEDIVDNYGWSIGYEGMRSFAIANTNVTDNDLNYWLSRNTTFPVGLLRACYGTFLTSLLVIYEHDRIADLSAGKFNVTWRRVAPVCVSLCNDYNCLYITGESDHGMGMEVQGDNYNIWNFRFACSFSFSLIEQLVGNNVWNDTTIGSVTLGLFRSYFVGESLEIIYSNGYVIFKRVEDNTTLLFLDSSTGIVRDVFSYQGILGTMPCYHDYITNNAVKYGNDVMNLSCDNHNALENLCNVSVIMPIFGFIGTCTAGAVGFVESISFAPILLFTLTVLMVVSPDDANELWEQFMYFVNPNLNDFHEVYNKVESSNQKEDYKQIYLFNFREGKDTIVFLRGNLFDTARYTFLSLFDNYQINFYQDFKRSIGVLSGITFKDVEVRYKVFKEYKWNKQYIDSETSGNVNSGSSGGGDNGSDIHGTFEGVGRTMREKYDSLVFNIVNKNFKSAVIDFNKLILIMHVPASYVLNIMSSLLMNGYNFKEGVNKIMYDKLFSVL